MLQLMNAESTVLLVLELALIALKIFAFVNSLLYPAAAYEAANKLTKPAWCIILGLGVAVQLVLGGVIGIITIVFTVAALVYLADVRPALSSLTRRR